MSDKREDIQVSDDIDKMGLDNQIALDKGDVRDMTAEDRATALHLAVTADPGIQVKSWRMVQMALCMLVVCTCGGDAGP
jgi:hypothetical protein